MTTLEQSVDAGWDCRCGRHNPFGIVTCPRCGRTEAMLAPPPVTRPGRGVRWWAGRAVGGVAAIALVVAGLSVVFPDHRPHQGPTVALDASPHPNSTLPDVVRQLESYVERARGLKYTAPVPVTVLDDAAFTARLKQGRRLDDADILGQRATLQALDLLPRDVDLAKASEESLAAVLGFYDPASKQVFVRGDNPTPYVRYLLVHELTHALQDQHYDLSRLPGGHDDAALAAKVLPEGDAERVMGDYVSTLSPLEQDAIQREATSREDDVYAVPFYLGVANFPYVVGAEYVKHILQAGGSDLLDRSFRDPPTSTAQIIRPDVFRGRAPTAVPAPAAGGRVVDEGVLGEFELISLLAQEMPGDVAFAAAGGWTGSHYVTWIDGNRACLRAAIATDGADHGSLLREGLSYWAERHGAAVTGTQPVTLNVCH